MMLSYVRRNLAITLGLVVLHITSGCSLHLEDIDRELADKAKQDAGEISDGSRTGAPDAAELDRGIDGTGGGPVGSDASGAGLDASLTDSEGRAEAPIKDASPLVSPEAGCSRDSDCPVDLAQCKASLCKSGICASATAYHLMASQFTIAGPPRAGLAGHRNGLIAAIYPYLFVVNAGGVAAFDVSNPKSGSPRPVRIDGLPSTPVVAVIAVGKVVYFVGSSTTADNGALQPLSWIDISSDGAVSPEGDVLHANVPLRVFIEPPLMPLQRPTKIDSLYNVLPSRPDGLFLVYNSKRSLHVFSHRAAQTPGDDGHRRPLLESGAGYGSRCCSGQRLAPRRLHQRWAAAQVRADNHARHERCQCWLAGYGAHDGGRPNGIRQQFYRRGALDERSADPRSDHRRPRSDHRDPSHAVLADENTATLSGITKVDPSTYVDLERYTPGIAASQVVVAPPVWISSTLALGLSADLVDPLGKTLVRLISVTGSKLSANTDAQVLPSPPATIDIASSNGFAYALGADATFNTVYILAPSCSLN